MQVLLNIICLILEILIVIGLYYYGIKVFYRFEFTGLIIYFITIPLLPYFIKKYVNGRANKYKTDLTNQVIIVTGANSGLGFESVKYMAKLNPKKIILACRNL